MSSKVFFTFSGRSLNLVDLVNSGCPVCAAGCWVLAVDSLDLIQRISDESRRYDEPEPKKKDKDGFE